LKVHGGIGLQLIGKGYREQLKRLEKAGIRWWKVGWDDRFRSEELWEEMEEFIREVTEGKVVGVRIREGMENVRFSSVFMENELVLSVLIGRKMKGVIKKIRCFREKKMFLIDEKNEKYVWRRIKEIWYRDVWHEFKLEKEIPITKESFEKVRDELCQIHKGDKEGIYVEKDVFSYIKSINEN
jgi:hypothetical protein